MPDIHLQIIADKARKPLDIVKRLELAFSYVIVDEKRGMSYAAEQMLAARSAGDLERAERLSSVLEDALQVILTDDTRSDKDFLSLYLIPGEDPLVHFVTDEHQRETTSLLWRCESALRIYTGVISEWLPPSTFKVLLTTGETILCGLERSFFGRSLPPISSNKLEKAGIQIGCEVLVRVSKDNKGGMHHGIILRQDRKFGIARRLNERGAASDRLKDPQQDEA